jgi:hypothetical protein
MLPLLRYCCVLSMLVCALHSTPHDARAGGSQLVHCNSRTICVPTLGIAVTLPTNWRATLTSYGLSVRPVANKQHAAAGHLLISLLGSTTRCTDRQIVSTVAGYWMHHSGPRLHITKQPMVVAGAPAMLITGLPGLGNFGVTLLVAHQGLLYGIYAFDSPRTVLTGGQRQVLAHLQFIPRAGRFPPQLDRSIPKALQTCSSRC